MRWNTCQSHRVNQAGLADRMAGRSSFCGIPRGWLSQFRFGYSVIPTTYLSFLIGPTSGPPSSQEAAHASKTIRSVAMMPVTVKAKHAKRVTSRSQTFAPE